MRRISKYSKFWFFFGLAWGIAFIFFGIVRIALSFYYLPFLSSHDPFFAHYVAHYGAVGGFYLIIGGLILGLIGYLRKH
jgi:hypothetical protein